MNSERKRDSAYVVTMYGEGGKSIVVDYYDIMDACEVTCSARAHAAKKLLFCGKRGHKDVEKDLGEAVRSALRAVELNKNKGLVEKKRKNSDIFLGVCIFLGISFISFLTFIYFYI